MASPSLDFRSPFNNVLNNLPQGHEKAFKQAIYTTAANLFVLVAVGAAVAVYFILEVFLRPLLWAVLCGTFLYPVKRSLTSWLRRWLHGLQTTNTPFVLGVAFIPIKAIDRVYGNVFNKFMQHIRMILGGFGGIVLAYLLWHFGPAKNILYSFRSVFYFVYEVLGYFTSFWIWTLLVGYLLAVVFLWSPDSKRYLRYLSVPIWIVLILHVATAAGYLRVPLLMFLVVVIVIGFVSEINEARLAEGKCVPPTPAEAARIIFGDDSETDQSKAVKEDKDEKVDDKSSSVTETESHREETEKSKDSCEVKKPSSLPVRSPTVSSASSPHKKDRPKLHMKELTEKSEEKSDEKFEEKARSLIDNCFIYLFWLLVLTRIWLNIWVVQLLFPIGLIMWLFKTLLIQLGSGGIVGEKVELVKTAMTKWLVSRQDVLMPRWIRGVAKLVLRGDSKIVSVLEQSLDKTTSVLFILLLLFGTAILVIFGAIQIQQESMLFVKMTSEVMNNTLNSEINSWLPNGEDLQKAMDSMVGNAYLYGRNWIAARLRDFVSGSMDKSSTNNTQIETQVLEVWDRLYESWLTRNDTSSSLQTTTGFNVLPTDMINVKSMWEVVSEGDAFNISQIVAFVKDNIGTFMSVLDSVWIVLKGNMNLVLSLVTATMSVVFGGGTALLNFVISSVIFLTTLFYLLATSGNQYKPLEWFSNLSPSQGTSVIGQAVEEAITGVVMASLKMAAFYGFYTWMTHTWFGVNIVFIPSVMAAMFAAVPFLGTYWATIPAILELWLVQGQGILALLLLIFHMLPTYVVDTAIYSEIKGGHPYMTGLAIAGGIYWMGLEGAIIGPILLCCLIVVIRLYGTMLQPDPATPDPGQDFNLNSDILSSTYHLYRRLQHDTWQKAALW
ncbi:transmembrane protein 245-like isoform X2 [Pecten maximus]|uniref:transmembrane protein 245-like isoform X2 n=1 Tax=Pecten maximus TaxID=6579 RepID=UPI0014587B73|nr:transmembrane protein 245-like isoform X2 [Pecten maximus]